MLQTHKYRENILYKEKGRKGHEGERDYVSKKSSLFPEMTFSGMVWPL